MAQRRVAKPRPAHVVTRGSRNVVLIGMRGVGKTTVGRALASRFGIEFVDLDAVIEAGDGRTVARIFEAEGEEFFRRREHLALREVAALPRPYVCSTGGGVVEREENFAWLRRAGTIVWLQGSIRTLKRRLASDARRPALTGKSVVAELAALLRRRGPRYRALADFSIRCGRDTPATIAARIAVRMGGRSEGSRSFRVASGRPRG